MRTSSGLPLSTLSQRIRERILQRYRDRLHRLLILLRSSKAERRAVQWLYLYWYLRPEVLMALGDAILGREQK